MKFSSTRSRCINPVFQNQSSLFCCLLFFKKYHNPQVKINKMVNEPSVNYGPSPSELTSNISSDSSRYYMFKVNDGNAWIRFEILIKTMKIDQTIKRPERRQIFECFISHKFLLNFLSNLHIPCLGYIFIFAVFRELENVDVGQKIKSRHFYSCPPSQNSPTGSCHHPLRQQFFEILYLLHKM